VNDYTDYEHSSASFYELGVVKNYKPLILDLSDHFCCAVSLARGGRYAQGQRRQTPRRQLPIVEVKDTREDGTFAKLGLFLIFDLSSITLHFVIQNFKQRGLRLLWEKGDGSKLPADQINRIERMLEVIDAAQQLPQDFEVYKNWHLHKLSGDWKGFWAIKVVVITGLFFVLRDKMLMI